jgi:hypothetical protein
VSGEVAVGATTSVIGGHMSEMTDRIANGILLCFNNMSGSREEVARSAAILAIQLMREPTGEMLEALYKYSPNEWDVGMYEVMIDAAVGDTR